MSFHGDEESVPESLTLGVKEEKSDESLHGSGAPGVSVNGDDEDIKRGRNAIDEQEKLVGSETKAIGRLRKVVFVVITLVAVLGSLGAFFFVEDEEKRASKAAVSILCTY